MLGNNLFKPKFPCNKPVKIETTFEDLVANVNKLEVSKNPLVEPK